MRNIDTASGLGRKFRIDKAGGNIIENTVSSLGIDEVKKRRSDSVLQNSNSSK